MRLSAEDTGEIKCAVSFDVGFPRNSLGGPGGATGLGDVGLHTNLGQFDWVDALEGHPSIHIEAVSEIPLTDLCQPILPHTLN